MVPLKEPASKKWAESQQGEGQLQVSATQMVLEHASQSVWIRDFIILENIYWVERI